jgi:hypothetical protein
MRPTAILVLLLQLVSPLFAAAQEFTTVSPGTAAAGTAVTVSGGPFGTGVTVLLGGREIIPDQRTERQLVFTVPPLPDGTYPLSLREGDRTSSRSYNFRVHSPPPGILSLSPANIDECATESQRQVVVEGRHFQPGARVLLDGKVIAHTRSGESTLTFTVPPLPAGIYGVQVINPDEKRSLPHSLWFNSIPEITSVRQGEDFVNYYELVIEGKNFTYNSVLVVSEYPSGAFDQPPQQKIVTAQGKTDPLLGRTQGDNLYFSNCHTLIYNRYPYSTQLKRAILQVVNPDGKRTSPYDVSIP